MESETQRLGDRETDAERDRGEARTTDLSSRNTRESQMQKKKQRRQLSRLGPELGLPWDLSTALPFSLLQGKGGILQGGPWVLEQGLPTSHICFPSGSHSWRICIPRLSLQSHNPFKTNRGFSFVAANPCRHLRFSQAVWGPAGSRLRQSQCRPGMQSWWQRAEKGSFWRGHGAPLALTWKGLGVLA